jgi:hypothetical protein
LFGRNNSKIEFDARQPQPQILQNAQSYQYVHNFKVHFKRGALQALANKVDISINSNSPQMPSIQEVTNDFNQRTAVSNAHSSTRRRFSETSYHITNIEYKESIALSYAATNFTPPQQGPRQMVNQSTFCRNCGIQLSADSRFCNKCGSPI